MTRNKLGEGNRIGALSILESPFTLSSFKQSWRTRRKKT